MVGAINKSQTEIVTVEATVVAEDVVQKPIIVIAVCFFTMALEVVLVDVEIAGVAGVKSVIVVDLIFKSFNPRNIDDTI